MGSRAERDARGRRRPRVFARPSGRAAALRRARGAPFWAASLALHAAAAAVLAQVVWRCEQVEAPEVVLTLALTPAPAPPAYLPEAKRNSVRLPAPPADPPLKAPARRARRIKEVVPVIPRGTDVAGITADLRDLAAIAALPAASKAAPAEEAPPSGRASPPAIGAPAGEGAGSGSGAIAAGGEGGGAGGEAAAAAGASGEVAEAPAAGGAAGSGAEASGGGFAQIYGVGEIDEAPARTRYVPPEFPSSARLRGFVGWVRLVFVVTATGSVEDIVVAELHGADDFAEAARAAAARWEFRPGRLNGRAVAVRCSVKITFRPQEA